MHAGEPRSDGVGLATMKFAKELEREAVPGKNAHFLSSALPLFALSPAWIPLYSL